MVEKRVYPWVLWEQCERRQGAQALSRLAGQLPEFFSDSRLVSSRWSRLPFYATHRLMELRFVRDRGVERAFVLHGPERTMWLNGKSDPMHDVNDAESVALTRSTAGDYIRFFLYFLRADEGAFVLIESADEVSPRAEAGGDEDQDDVITFEDARDRACPLPMRDVDETGRWLFDATVAYGEALFSASLAVDAGGIVEMLDDEPIGLLDAIVVPQAPLLELPEATDSPGAEEVTRATEPPVMASGPPGRMAPRTAFGQNAGLPSGTGELFVGRATEQDEFRRVLELAGGAAGDPDEAHVVLVHGLGGIGKSTLLRRLHETARKSRRGGPVVADIVDCEDERRRNRGDYTGPDGPPVGKLLDRLYTAVRDSAPDRQAKAQLEKAFKDFRQTMAAQPELSSRASQLGIGAPGGQGQLSVEQLSALGQTTVDAARIIGATTGLVVPHVGIPITAVATTAGAAMGAARRYHKGPVDDTAYDALVADRERLVGQFARGLKELSRRAGPVVLFIDTGELLGEALEWLRAAAQHSGSRVVWVLGLRLEAESDAGLDSEAVRFRRSIADTRLWSMPLTRFDDRTVEDYLRARLGDRYPKDLDITAVARLTHGVPLAVFLASQLLAGGQDLTSALAAVRDGEVSSVIRELAQRYLVHARNSPALQPDLSLLYGLALLYGEVGPSGFPGDPAGGARRDPDALAALWDVPAGTVADRLDDLAVRHDFVLSGRRRLHQEVREAVLLLLLDPYQRPAVRDMSARAAALYRARAVAAGYPTVDAQLADQGWQATVTALLWHTFWADLDSGLQMLKGLFAAAVTVDASFAAALLRAATFFAPACRDDGQRLISDLQLVTDLQLTFGPAPARRAKAAAAAREVIKALKDCPAEPLLASAPPAAAYYDLLRASCHEALGLTAPDLAALLLRAAGGVEPGGVTAQAVLFQVRQLATDPAATRETIVSALSLITRLEPGDAIARNNLGNALYELGRSEEATAAYREALRLDPGEAVYDNNLGNALYELGRHEEATAAYREALRLNPGEAAYDNNLGNALCELGRYDEAAAAYREALRLDPAEAGYHTNLGNTLAFLGRYDEAETVHREALRLTPGDVETANNVGYTLIGQGRYDEAETAYRAGLRLDPSDTNAYNGLGHVLSGLGRHGEAEAAYREALRLDPGFALAYGGLGRLHLKVLGRVDEAAAELREAVRLDPSTRTRTPISGPCTSLPVSSTRRDRASCRPRKPARPSTRSRS